MLIQHTRTSERIGIIDLRLVFFMSGTNHVKAILTENSKFSEVYLFRKLLLIIFIVEKAASQVYVDPNIDKYTAKIWLHMNFMQI